MHGIQLNSVLLLLTVVLAIVGLALLALCQQKHAEAVLGRRGARLNTDIALPSGWALVLSSLVPCVLRDGASFATLLWPLIIAAAAIATTMALSYRPALLKPLARSLERTAGEKHQR